MPAVVAILSAAIFTRALSSAAYGRFSLAQSVAVLVATLSSQWLIQSTNRFLPEARSAGARQESYETIVLGLLWITGGTLGLALVAIPVVGALVGPSWDHFVWPAAALILTTSLLNPLRTVLQARMEAGRFALYKVWEVVLRFVLALGLVFLVSRSAAGLLWAGPIAMALLIVPLWRHTGLPTASRVVERWRQLRPVMRRWGAYGFPLIGWSLGAVLLSVGDRYVIQLVRGEAEVGIYSANYGLVAGAVGLLAAPVRLAAHPFLMRAWGSGDRDAAGRWLGTITEWYLIGTLLIVGPFVLFAKDLVQILLGPEFREGYSVIPIVLAGLGFYQLGLYAHKPLEFMNRTRVMLFLSIGVAAANVGLNVALVPAFGYHAAAWTTLGCYALYAVLAAYAGRGVLRWQIRWKALGGTLGVLIGGLAAAVVARRLVELQLGYVPGMVVGALVVAATAPVGILRISRSLTRPVV